MTSHDEPASPIKRIAPRDEHDPDEILESVVEHLSKSGGNTTLTIEINSEAAGFDDRTQRVVKENAAQLGAKSQEFE